jgi:ribosomal-protein-alanine N-acetyltransferase
MTTIKTKDFVLRPIKMADAPAFLEMSLDKATKKGFLNPAKTIQDVKKTIKKKILEYRKKEPSDDTFVIEVKGEFAGFVSVHDLNKKYFKHRATIGYALHPKFRGKGLTTKAVKIMTAYAFKKYKLKRLEGWCRTFNKASARVLERAGYKLEGILRKNKCKDGKYLDDMVWAKVK